MDVTARGLANAYSQTLGQIFTHELKPYEIELMVAEVGSDSHDGTNMFRIQFDGTLAAVADFGAMGGNDAKVTEVLEAGWAAELDLAGAVAAGDVRHRGGRAAHRRAGRLGGGGARPDPGTSQVPPAHRRRPRHGAERRSPLAGYCATMQRRIYGIENEYGVTCTLRGQRRLSPDEVARYLFRRVVSWGRSSNVFLENGARLYLDVGSHPEYATPECDSLLDLVAHDKAGERILESLLTRPSSGWRRRASAGRSTCSRTTPTRPGNSYGCHENYLVSRHNDFQQMVDTLIPFLVTRQIFPGAGKLLQTARGTVFCLSQRAEHIWEGVSSATTRSRPIINTRDEPHADAERYRRLHVIAGDSNMTEYATRSRWGRRRRCSRCSRTTWCSATSAWRTRSGRSGRSPTTSPAGARCGWPTAGSCRRSTSSGSTSTGRCATAAPSGSPPRWRTPSRCGSTCSPGWRRTRSASHRECDWVIKHRLIERYVEERSMPLSDPRLAMLDLAYHDVKRDRGLYYLLERRGLVERVVTDEVVTKAETEPPATTRARLRGEFIKAAKARKRDFTVDWVHLKLNDQAQRTVLCKDPFQAVDERVDKLIAGL